MKLFFHHLIKLNRKKIYIDFKIIPMIPGTKEMKNKKVLYKVKEKYSYENVFNLKI